MKTSSKLKPCPFCGGEGKKSWIPESMALPGTVGGFTVMCKSCLAFQLSGAKTEQEATSAWNRRAEIKEGGK
jgi:Lar family restriction alleviation protein